jgi:hypothetical protein
MLVELLTISISHWYDLRSLLLCVRVVYEEAALKESPVES